MDGIMVRDGGILFLPDNHIIRTPNWGHVEEPELAIGNNEFISSRAACVAYNMLVAQSISSPIVDLCLVGI